MPQKSTTFRALLTTICVSVSLNIASIHAYATTQDKDKGQNAKKKDADKATNDDDAISSKDARPVLWTEPTDIESRDLFYGPGAARERRTPQASSSLCAARHRAPQKRSLLKTTRAGVGP